MLNNNKSLKLNREERRRQERLARKERARSKVIFMDKNDDFVPFMKIPLTPPRIESRSQDIELEDGRWVKGVSMHFTNCNFELGKRIATSILDFVKSNSHIFAIARGFTYVEPNKDYFDIVLININNIDQNLFEKMIDDFLSNMFNFEVIGYKEKGER